jgi:hypothetical protein
MSFWNLLLLAIAAYYIVATVVTVLRRVRGRR